MNQSENIGKLAEALAKAQGEMRGAIRDSANPFFKSKYADLAAVWDACRDALAKNSIAVVQSPQFGGAVPVLRTTIAHASGEWIAGDHPIVVAKQNDPQALGSALTYARRYSLAAMVGIATVDDDAESAMGRTAETTKSDYRKNAWSELGQSWAQQESSAPKAQPAVTQSYAAVQGKICDRIEMPELKGLAAEEYTDEQLERAIAGLHSLREQAKQPENIKLIDWSLEKLVDASNSRTANKQEKKIRALVSDVMKS